MSGEKTEKPTSKRRNDAVKDGDLLSSNDINTVISLFGIFYCLKLLFSDMVQRTLDFFYYIFDIISKDFEISESFFNTIFQDMMIFGVQIIFPIALAAMFFGVLGTFLQNKPKLNWKLIKWDFKKLNILKGLKKFVSLKKVFDVLKGVLKISVMGYILYSYINGAVPEFVKFFDMDLIPSATLALDKIMGLVVRATMAFSVIATMDYAYAKYEYEKKLKMSKHDIKEEHKQQEGDPKVKSKIKQTQMKMAMQRMMQEVPTADVVIRNPTHYAVALKYDLNSPGAPVLVAKGQDEMALRIIQVAEEAGVVVIENVALARAIHATTELDREIPPEFYGTIAEILVYVYKLKNKELA